ncbi:MAG: hypothetical protein HZC28_19985 [Spirochaetes bacterium]|nr:hypothetical protein [Spirochaetota bacterium]
MKKHMLFSVLAVLVLTSCVTDIQTVYVNPLIRMEYKIIRGEQTCEPWGKTWLVSTGDVADLDKAICEYLKVQFQKNKDMNTRDILARYERYKIQYCGFVRNGVKMIYCHLFNDETGDFSNWKRLDEFVGLGVSGGEGKTYVYLIYDTKAGQFTDYWAKGN